MTRLFFAIVLASVGFGQTALTRVWERQEIYGMQLWSGHLMLGCEKSGSPSPIVLTMDAAGRKDEIVLRIPGMAHVSVNGLAAKEDGTVVAVGTKMDEHGERGGFLATFSPDHLQATIVPTEPFFPEAGTVDNDGVIWAVGTMTVDKKTTGHVLARFSPTGKPLTSQAIEVKWDSDKAPSIQRMAATRDRVGWLTDGGEYLEFSASGSEVFRVNATPWAKKYPGPVAMAMGPDLSVVLGTWAEMWSLDRAKRAWVPVSVDAFPKRGGAQMYGFDGDQLVVGTTEQDRGYVLVHCRLGN